MPTQPCSVVYSVERKMNHKNVQAMPRRPAAALIPIWPLAIGLLFAALPVTAMSDPDVSALEARVEQLTRQLEQAKAELATVRSRVVHQDDEAVPAPEAVATRPEDTPRGDITIGPVTVGGAMRVNYIYGSYEDSGSGPSRGGDGGNVELDTIRANLALDYRQWIGELEYRWYNGYNFLHTGWLGYRLDEDSQVQVGITRVPFGAGPYGVSQSWFFDQHYYMGLADDMDLGVKYVGQLGQWKLDLAYFVSSEGNWNGSSKDSARYSYDAVKWDSALDPDGNVVNGPLNGYAERNQLNVRAIYALEFDSWTADIGASLQYGQFDGKRADDGNAWAAAVHMVSEFGNCLLGAQLSRCRIDVITAGGKTNPPVAQRIFWAVTEGVVAAALLVGGGLTALQTAAITTGLPFAVLLLVLIFSLQKAMSGYLETAGRAGSP